MDHFFMKGSPRARSTLSNVHIGRAVGPLYKTVGHYLGQISTELAIHSCWSLDSDDVSF